MMVDEIVTFLQDNLLIDEHGELDEEELDNVCEKMAQSFGGEDDYE